MKSILAVILSVIVLAHQGSCLTDEELVDAGLWTDAVNGVAAQQQRPEMSDICRFLLRGNEMDPTQVDRSNVNLYRSLYVLMAYINEDALMRQMVRRCREQQQQPQEETMYKRSEGEKVVGKKQKFHSWGGKRTGGGGGDGVIPNPVYRAKFHSWGGKRSLPADSGPME